MSGVESVGWGFLALSTGVDPCCSCSCDWTLLVDPVLESFILKTAVGVAALALDMSGLEGGRGGHGS